MKIERSVFVQLWVATLCGLPVFNSEIIYGGLVSKVEISFDELLRLGCHSVFLFVPARTCVHHSAMDSNESVPKWKSKLPTCMFFCFSSVGPSLLSGDRFLKFLASSPHFHAHQGLLDLAAADDPV